MNPHMNPHMTSTARPLSARIARADAIRRLAGAVAPFAGALALLGAGAWAVGALERNREAVASAAVAYCTDAATLGASATLDGLREGMMAGDDTDGIVYRAALAGLRAQCAEAVAKVGGR